MEHRVLREVLYLLYQGFCTSRVSYVFIIHTECNLFYANKKRTAFPKPIFTKLTNDRHYVQNVTQVGQEIC
jgi:hypothetical protein